MDRSLHNIGFWAPLGLWALAVFTMAFVIARFVLRSPRYRAILLLCAVAMSVLPFFANVLPDTREYGIVSTREFSTVYIPFPMRILSSTPNMPAEYAAVRPKVEYDPWPQRLLNLWFLGSAVSLLLLARAILHMNRLVKTEHADAPMVAGFPVSRVLLPVDWPTGLTQEEADAALAHEQAHLKGFHMQGRIMFELFRCLFWWVPTVHLAAREYERALEELADAEAVRRTKPEALASALVKVAAIQFRPGLAIGATSNGRHLQVRLKKIMEKRNPGSWPLSLVVILAAGGAAYAAAPRIAAEPAVQQELASVKPAYGLEKGASWTYDYGYGKDDHSLMTQTVTKVTSDGDLTVFELVTGTGNEQISSSRYYSYAAVDKASGFFTLANRGMMGPGYEKSLRTPRLIRPFAKGASWKWFAAFRGQTMMGPDGKAPDTTKWDRNCVATIEGEEDVTVKAGKFHCYRVRVDVTSRTDGTVHRTEWISLEVGTVKMAMPAQGKVVANSSELVKYSPGP